MRMNYHLEFDFPFEEFFKDNVTFESQREFIP